MHTPESMLVYATLASQTKRPVSTGPPLGGKHGPKEEGSS